jgi:mRNA-degrading endonuclease RelE of RelBE toxin-antitoxin system
VRHFTSSRFWKLYQSLPPEIQELADASFARLKANPRHPAVQLKKVDVDTWSARVGLHYRALGIDGPSGIIWVWIGPHSEYDTILRG